MVNAIIPNFFIFSFSFSLFYDLRFCVICSFVRFFGTRSQKSLHDAAFQLRFRGQRIRKADAICICSILPCFLNYSGGTDPFHDCQRSTSFRKSLSPLCDYIIKPHQFWKNGCKCKIRCRISSITAKTTSAN